MVAESSAIKILCIEILRSWARLQALCTHESANRVQKLPTRKGCAIGAAAFRQLERLMKLERSSAEKINSLRRRDAADASGSRGRAASLVECSFEPFAAARPASLHGDRGGPADRTQDNAMASGPASFVVERIPVKCQEYCARVTRVLRRRCTPKCGDSLPTLKSSEVPRIRRDRRPARTPPSEQP